VKFLRGKNAAHAARENKCQKTHFRGIKGVAHWTGSVSRQTENKAISLKNLQNAQTRCARIKNHFAHRASRRNFSEIAFRALLDLCLLSTSQIK